MTLRSSWIYGEGNRNEIIQNSIQYIFETGHWYYVQHSLALRETENLSDLGQVYNKADLEMLSNRTLSKVNNIHFYWNGKFSKI